MSGESLLNGLTLGPASGSPARQLVVLLHGYGADGSDLLPIAQAWQAVLPDAAFALPNGPSPCDEFPAGRQWFPLALRDRPALAAGAASVAGLLDAYLEQTLAEVGLDGGDLVLAGFSQGAMMALHVGLRRPEPPLAIVSFSGVLAADPPDRKGPFPPVFLGHGSEDPLIPAGALKAAEAQLSEAGANVQSMLRPGLGHGIDQEEVVAAARFLAEKAGSAMV